MNKAIILSGLLCVAGCSSSPPSESRDDLAGTQSRLVASPMVEAARTMLETAVPEWDKTALARAPIPSSSGPQLEKPLEVASSLSRESFEYVETRPNGRAVYKNASRDVTVKVDPGRGYWKLIAPPPPPGTGATVFSLQDAEQETLRLYGEFGLPVEQGGAVIVTDIGRMTSDGARAVVARHVRIHREVNGLRVTGSRLMATYGLDGTPFRVEVRWPDFALKPADQLRDRDQVLSDLATFLGRLLERGQSMSEVLAELNYRFDENTREFEPVVSISPVRSEAQEEGPLETFEYSLIDGLPSTPDAIGEEAERE
jgi:hypothetical protein